MGFSITKQILARAKKLYSHSNLVEISENSVMFHGKNCKMLCRLYARECYLDDESWVDAKPIIYRKGNGYGFDFNI